MNNEIERRYIFAKHRRSHICIDERKKRVRQIQLRVDTTLVIKNIST